MAALLKTSIFFFVMFGLFFGLISMTGVMDPDSFEEWLKSAHTISSWHVSAMVVALLMFDLVFSVPTLTVTILAGYFLGFELGALSAFVGLLGSGLTGYFLGTVLGEKILSFVIRDKREMQSLKSTFKAGGFVMILLSRALPFLPEFTSCLAGVTRMPLPRFLLAWHLSVVPYVTINAYFGSISSLDNPKPALLGAVGTSVLLFTLWRLYRRQQLSRPQSL